MKVTVRRVVSAARRRWVLLATRADRRFGVRSAMVPDGRTLWIVLESIRHVERHDDRRLSSLCIEVAPDRDPHDAVGREVTVQRGADATRVTLSAAIDLTPLVEGRPGRHRLSVSLVDGTRRRPLRIVGDVTTASNGPFMNVNVPHPQRALRIVPVNASAGTLAIDVRPMSTTVWAAGTSVDDETFTVHGHCVPVDSPAPAHVTMAGPGGSKVELVVRADASGDGRWSAAVPISALTEVAATGPTTWTVKADGARLRRRPDAVRTPVLLHPRWTVHRDARRGQLTTSFRKAGVLTIELDWIDSDDPASQPTGAPS